MTWTYFRHSTSPWVLTALLVAAPLLGCNVARHAIITGTGTNIGVDISQNPTTQTPQAKLGYQRGEVAIVPTNRSAAETPGNAGAGAAQHGEVLMELSYGGIFDTGPSSGIYQRLAVGTTAVKQPGATMMFTRNAEGEVDKNAEAALKALETVPAELGPGVDSFLARLTDLRTCHKAEVDKAWKDAAIASWDDLMDQKATLEQVRQVENATKALSECGS